MINGMETLQCLIGRIYNQRQPRVPGRIDTSREDGVVLHVNLTHLTVVGDNSTSLILASMELHALWIVLLIMVTINTLSVFFKATKHIVIDNALVIVFQTTLINGQGFITNERRENETVTQVTVNAIRRHEDTERLVVRPLVCLTSVDINGNGTTLSLLCKCTPFIGFRLSLSFTDNFFITNSITGNHPIGSLIKLEGERCHVDGDGDIGIVGINLGKPVGLCKGIWHRGGCTAHHRQTDTDVY